MQFYCVHACLRTTKHELHHLSAHLYLKINTEKERPRDKIIIMVQGTISHDSFTTCKKVCKRLDTCFFFFSYNYLDLGCRKRCT